MVNLFPTKNPKMHQHNFLFHFFLLTQSFCSMCTNESMLLAALCCAFGTIRHVYTHTWPTYPLSLAHGPNCVRLPSFRIGIFECAPYALSLEWWWSHISLLLSLSIEKSWLCSFGWLLAFFFHFSVCHLYAFDISFLIALYHFAHLPYVFVSFRSILNFFIQCWFLISTCFKSTIFYLHNSLLIFFLLENIYYFLIYKNNRNEKNNGDGEKND